MIPQPISNATHRFAPPPNWDEAVNGPCATIDVIAAEVRGEPYVFTFFKPTPEELKLLNEGHFVSLGIRGTGFPVVTLGVSE